MMINASMFLRYDRVELSLTTPDASEPYANSANSLRALIRNTCALHRRERMGLGPHYRGEFNDLETYLRLSARGKAEIRQISVNHNDYCLGIKVTYNSGSDCITHHSNPNSGYYTWHGGPKRESSLILADDEYLCEVRTRQGEITDQVTFCTNKRTVSFGGNGGAADPRDVCNTPVDLTKRVVAIVGTFTQGGALGKIGTISVPRNWEVIGEFILVRELVERERASPNPLCTRGQVDTKEETVLQAMMNVDESIFHRVLSFVIANIETDQV